MNDPGVAQGLVAVVTRADPFFPALVGSGEMAGPLLTAVAANSWRRLVLLAPEDLAVEADACGTVLRERWPGLAFEGHALDCASSSSCARWVDAVREWFRARGVSLLGDGTDWVVAGSPGAMAWHAAWLLLMEGGETGVGVLDVLPATGPGLRPECHWAARRPGRSTAQGWRIQETAAAPYRVSRAGSRRGTQGASVQQILREMGVWGEHPAWRRALEVAVALAPHGVPVLIQGETGTGKGMLARLIHRAGPCPDGPFVSVNCGALPKTLIGSVLFGHTRGAFTGADRDQVGKFEEANGGTLFLDEIGEMPMELQPHLLKVLEDGVVEPVGARGGRPVQVRILAATNRNLMDAIQEQAFREDLYYRLSYGLVDVPPLRERAADIPLLAARLLEQVNASLRVPKRISPEGLAWLCAQRWDGNVRDLQNVIGRTALLCGGEEMGPHSFAAAAPSPRPCAAGGLPTPHEGFCVEAFLRDARRDLFGQALQMTGGSQSAAARLLGVSPQAVHSFVRGEEGKV